MDIYDDEFLRISTLPYDLIGLINFIYTKEYKFDDVIKLLNNPNKKFDGIDGNFYFKDNMIETLIFMICNLYNANDKDLRNEEGGISLTRIISHLQSYM